MGETGNSWEAQFALIDITADTTKYYVVAALSTSTAGSVLNILDLPLEQGKYKPLKAHLSGHVAWTLDCVLKLADLTCFYFCVGLQSYDI